MFWVVLLAVGLAVVFIKLGALSVWVGIFKSALQIVAFVVMGLLGILFWQRVSRSEKVRNLRIPWGQQSGPQSPDGGK